MKRMIIIAMVVLIALSITACGKGKKIDSFLNTMETALKADEGLVAAGTSSFKDGAEVTAKYSQMLDEAEKLLNIPEKGSQAQKDRYSGLKQRIEDMASKIVVPPVEQASTEVAESSPNTAADKSGKIEGKTEIDVLLDTYETTIVTYEKKGGNLSVTDIIAINKKLVELNNTKKSAKMTKEQSNRLLNLIERLVALTVKKK